jgi:predicted GNAT family acetyltransferase
VAGPDLTAPTDWTLVTTFDALQMVATDVLVARPDPEAVVLGEADVEDLTDLVARTEPGPFRSQTWRMGTYLGLRVEGRLVAMAGERMRLPGWTEISAVCTDPDFRGQGLAARLIQSLAAAIRGRGERPMMHVLTTNTGAIRLYEHLGFSVRRPMTFLVVRPPDRRERVSGPP